MAISTTSFKSDAVRCKILGAMRRSIQQGYSVVKNRKGDNFLLVQRVRGNVFRCFRFLDKNLNDVTELVYRGLK